MEPGSRPHGYVELKHVDKNWRWRRWRQRGVMEGKVILRYWWESEFLH